ncbi:MAG: hypothetical protein JNJ54_07435 [Myxococcaceae bacterium]|nr:hypothetical protein [Myxococcaceae bacterium]
MATACDNRGSAGAACIVEGGLLNPSYRCNDALVCNTGRQPPVCELANVGTGGAPCGSDRNCQVQLWCPPASMATCATRLKEGEACPAGVGCEQGLSCVKGDAGIVCQR